MAWLLRDDEVLASAEVVSGLRRLRALSGGADGVVVLRPARAAVTFGAGGPVDLVFCDAGMEVLEVLAAVPPGRLTRPRPRARVVIGGEAGFADRFRLQPGDHLELRE